jgi:hypothetical protein
MEVDFKSTYKKLANSASIIWLNRCNAPGPADLTSTFLIWSVQPPQPDAQSPPAD